MSANNPRLARPWWWMQPLPEQAETALTLKAFLKASTAHRAFVFAIPVATA
ncbi:MAG: hypothetical protein ACOYLS_01395 [Polymorphobacter sp.]